jgi:sporulation protein YlmC with PRC-barrel domain
MRATELMERPVMDLATATTIGRIDDISVDPVTRQVVGLHLAKTPGRATWLAWERLTAVGADAVTVPDGTVLTEPPAGSTAGRLRAGKALGGRVLTDEGYELADLADVEIDVEAALVTTLVLADGTEVSADRLRGLGRHATVVADPSRTTS